MRRLKSVLSDAIIDSGPSDNTKRYDKYVSTTTGAPCIPLYMNAVDALCLSFEGGKSDIQLLPMDSLRHPLFGVYSKSDILLLLDCLLDTLLLNTTTDRVNIIETAVRAVLYP